MGLSFLHKPYPVISGIMAGQTPGAVHVLLLPQRHVEGFRR